MKISTTCVLLTAILWTGTGYCAEPPVKAPEPEVQKNLESIVANCEKKKLPTEKEIECIEEGYRQFMGEPPPDNS